MRVSFPFLPLVLAAVTAISAPALSAQTDSPTSATHLAEISSTLTRIADLLESQIEGRHLDLVMQRIELRQRRLTPLESRLRLARASRDDYEEDRSRLRSQLKNMEDQLASGALAIETDGIINTTDYIASELPLTEARLRATNDEIAALENEVTRYRNEIEDWESWVDRELSDL